MAPREERAIVSMKSFVVDELRVEVHADGRAVARRAAEEAGRHLRDLLGRKEELRLILATGNSQIEFLGLLQQDRSIDWSRIVLFHMDEYLGIPADHPASFRRYMKERVESRVGPRAFHYLEGDALLPQDECDRYAALLGEAPVDLCCLGIGENGHIAFNDPSVADLEDRRQVKLVKLDRACRLQQVGEGHFPALDSVPPYALTLTIPVLCSASRILCLAPEKRKSGAVRAALEDPVSSDCPASVLRRARQATLLLDTLSASRLSI